MLSSNMLLLNLILLIEVTFSTPTGVLASLRRLFAKIRSLSEMGINRQLSTPV
jgi:hypothetical protein